VGGLKIAINDTKLVKDACALDRGCLWRFIWFSCLSGHFLSLCVASIEND
jgi:hypothetical protein